MKNTILYVGNSETKYSIVRDKSVVGVETVMCCTVLKLFIWISVIHVSEMNQL